MPPFIASTGTPIRLPNKIMLDSFFDLIDYIV